MLATNPDRTTGDSAAPVCRATKRLGRGVLVAEAVRKYSGKLWPSETATRKLDIRNLIRRFIVWGKRLSRGTTRWGLTYDNSPYRSSRSTAPQTSGEWQAGETASQHCLSPCPRGTDWPWHVLSLPHPVPLALCPHPSPGNNGSAVCLPAPACLGRGAHLFTRLL